MVVVSAQVQVRRHGRIRDHEVQLAQLQRPQQLVQRAFAAHELHRLRQAERGVHEPLRNLFGDHVVDARDD